MCVGVRKATNTQKGRSRGQLRLCIRIQLQAPATVASSSESPAGGTVIHAAASAGKLSDLHPMRGFLGVPEGDKNPKGDLAALFYCL